MKKLTIRSITLHCSLIFTIITLQSDDHKNVTYNEETIQYYRNLYKENPDNLQYAQDLAYVLAYTYNDTEALDIYYYIAQQDPTNINTLNNIALLLTRSEKTKEAINFYKQALEYQDNALVHLNLAIAYLTDGDLARGFQQYEWRWEAFNKNYVSSLNAWDGCNLEDKRICIHAEQGLGDTLMFIRYLMLLKNMGAHVIFVTQPSLKTLLQQCPYIDTLCTFNDPLPEHDYFCALLSLPSIFKTQLDTIPAPIPYLYAHTELVHTWEQQIKDEKRYKIGICWQGNIINEETAKKSCPLDHFKIIAEVPGVALYSIQKLDSLNDISTSSSFVHIFNQSLDEKHGSFMDTAAIINNLDLVITIDTSIAHLSAALGKPTWVILAKPCDWRWMKTTTRTPWYPNVRLFRQHIPGNWSEVMHAVAHALQEQLDSTKRYS
jgi:ADP-heptose:LPS heptosyltransferase